MTAGTQSQSRPGWRSVLKAPFEWLDTGLDWFERSTLIVCILAMASVSVANVLSRNVLGSSLLYANDLTQILLVLVTFMGIGIGARHARHIRVSALHDMLPHRARKVLLILVSFTTALLLFTLASYGWDYAMAAQRSCRVLPESWHMPMAVVLPVILVALALAGHLNRLGHQQWRKRSEPLSPLARNIAMVFLVVVGLLIASWLFELFVELVKNRSGRCRVTSSTQFPVYIVYMIVPMGFLLGGIQFFLAGVRNLISRDNYLSWYNKDEYESADDAMLNAEVTDSGDGSGQGSTPASDTDNSDGRGGSHNG
ncbi:MAG: TRAP transporter small permease subunit [Oleiphilaceae bacterium]|nr:TRAP transporter small permease subunit [Oleiphilaceae bacterium]